MELDDAEKIVEIRSLLKGTRDTEEEVSAVEEQLQSDLGEPDYLDVLEEKSLRMQNRVSPILKGIKFSSQSDGSSLNQAIDHFRDKDGVLDENAPMELGLTLQRYPMYHGNSLGSPKANGLA